MQSGLWMQPVLSAVLSSLNLSIADRMRFAPLIQEKRRLGTSPRAMISRPLGKRKSVGMVREAGRLRPPARVRDGPVRFAACHRHNATARFARVAAPILICTVGSPAGTALQPMIRSCGKTARSNGDREVGAGPAEEFSKPVVKRMDKEPVAPYKFRSQVELGRSF